MKLPNAPLSPFRVVLALKVSHLEVSKVGVHPQIMQVMDDYIKTFGDLGVPHFRNLHLLKISHGTTNQILVIHGYTVLP
jgi:hypothetical protein